MIRQTLYIGTMVSMLGYMIVGFKSCWGKPYDFSLIAQIPWGGWVLLVLTVLFYFLAQRMEK
jgi:hypothetical protein